MKMPHVQTIAGLDELIDVFGHPDRLAQRLAEWKAMEDALNAKIEALGGLSDIEDVRSRAESLLEEARAAKRKNAEEHDRLALLGAEIDQQHVARGQALDDRAAALDVREAVLGTRETEAASKSAAAELASERAERARLDFEAKAREAEALATERRALIEDARAKLATLGG